MTNLFMEGFHMKSKDGTVIDIPINAKVSIIRGDSATGKTKMIKFMSDIIAADEVASCNIDIDRIRVIRDNSEFKLFINSKELREHIIFIDKFDITDFSISIPFLEQSHNYFVVCAHRELPRCGWDRDSLLELKHTKKKYELRPLKFEW